ncbi:MAG: crossover junction endodeoxyribonuclease RuvC [Verrucomicrobiota bacterium]
MSEKTITVERVLAVDPSLRGTGYAVLERSIAGRQVKALKWGVIKNAPSLAQSACLVAIHETIRDLIEEFQPTQAAFESVIFVQSQKTAIVLGCARGAAILAAAQRGLEIFEYPPKRVKQAVAGRGGAQKDQVAFMVRAVLGLTETPAADAADALAVGLTHFQAMDAARIGVAQLERI